MDGSSMEPNARYLLRIDRKQVPVVYNGFERWSSEGGEIGARQHAFTRLDTGEWVFKHSARALSKHYDDCSLAPNCERLTSNCSCHDRLEAERGAPAQPAPAKVTA